jgi:hypothetical protein
MRLLASTHGAPNEFLHYISVTRAAGLFGHQRVEGERMGIPVVPYDQFIIGIASNALSGYDFWEQRLGPVISPGNKHLPQIRLNAFHRASAHCLPGPVLYRHNSKKTFMGGFLIRCLSIAQVAVRAHCRHACLRRNLTSGYTKMCISQSQHFLIITMTFDASLTGGCTAGEEIENDTGENYQTLDIHSLSIIN